MSDISESVFNRVPRRVHLNSGFSITELTSQGDQVYNLLAEVGGYMLQYVNYVCMYVCVWDLDVISAHKCRNKASNRFDLKILFVRGFFFVKWTSIDQLYYRYAL